MARKSRNRSNSGEDSNNPRQGTAEDGGGARRKRKGGAAKKTPSPDLEEEGWAHDRYLGNSQDQMRGPTGNDGGAGRRDGMNMGHDSPSYPGQEQPSALNRYLDNWREPAPQPPSLHFDFPHPTTSPSSVTKSDLYSPQHPGDLMGLDGYEEMMAYGEGISGAWENQAAIMMEASKEIASVQASFDGMRLYEEPERSGSQGWLAQAAGISGDTSYSEPTARSQRYERQFLSAAASQSTPAHATPSPPRVQIVRRTLNLSGLALRAVNEVATEAASERLKRMDGRRAGRG